MKLIYIAGPFRAPTAWDVETNVRRAEELALEVAKLGAFPVCPHTNTRFFDGQLNDKFWIDGTLALLRRCDALITTPNWRVSFGARGEVNDASERKQPVFHELAELGRWLNQAVAHD